MLDLMVREIDGVFRPLEGSVNPGTDLRGVDILVDVPGVLTIAAMHYSNGTMHELAITDAAEPEDFNLVSPHIPYGAIWVSSHESVTHGLEIAWEVTHCLWVANPPAE